MKVLSVGLALLAVLCLTGCNKRTTATVLGVFDDLGHHGHYAGVGIYAPNEAWTKVAAAGQPAGPAAATIDDQAIIVVVNSDTGELRACGDLSGYCVGMNPWDKPLAPSGHTPIALTGHAKPPLESALSPAPDAAATP